MQDLGAESVTENIPVVQKSQIVIVSVKPHIVPIALGDLKGANIDNDKLFLSVAMGVTIKQLEQVGKLNKLAFGLSKIVCLSNWEHDELLLILYYFICHRIKTLTDSLTFCAK